MTIVEAPAAGSTSDEAVLDRLWFVSADSHVNEPRDLWSANLPRRLQEQAMRGIEAGADGGWNLVLDGQHIFQKSMQEESDRLAVLNPEHRLQVMRTDGVGAECIFPTIGLYVWLLKDAEGGNASCRIYNDWIAEQLQRHSARFCCAGLIPTWQPERAVAEVEHVAALGLRAVMLPAIAEPMWNRDEWNRLWEVIAATGLPVVMHQGTGHDMVWYRGRGATITNLIATQSMAPRVATMLATSGILEQHPNVHVVFVEFNTGWLAWTMETADYYDRAFRKYDEFKTTRGGRASIYPDLPNPPSYYLKRQIHSTFQHDEVGIAAIERSGVAGLMWGNDYPHEEGTYPDSKRIVRQQAAGLSAEVTRRIFRDNAAAVFKIDPALLDVAP